MIARELEAGAVFRAPPGVIRFVMKRVRPDGDVDCVQLQRTRDSGYIQHGVRTLHGDLTVVLVEEEPAHPRRKKSS